MGGRQGEPVDERTQMVGAIWRRSDRSISHGSTATRSTRCRRRGLGSS